MASLSEAQEQPARQLWDQVNGVHAGMLGISGL
ncbi:general stress protein, partial [Pseudomonas sp. BGM005]|nr:general stress protein [Pseudomonas sp. BG5]